MRIVTNERLIRRNRKIAQYAFFITLGLLFLGLLVTNIAPSSPLMLIAPLIVLPVALGATFYSVRMANQWLREPMPEAIIQRGIKGVSSRSVLYNYVLPAHHLLVAPQGVFTLTIRPQEGTFRVEGERWSRKGGILGKLLAFFRQDMLGDPNYAAMRDAEKIQVLLDKTVPGSGVKVQPVILFTSPRAQVEIIDPVIPVLYADGKRRPNLKGYLKDLKKQGDQPTLNETQIAALESAIGIAETSNTEETEEAEE